MFNNKLIYKKNKKKYKFPLLSVVNFFLKKLRILSKKGYKLRCSRSDLISKSMSRRKIYVHQGRTWVKLKLTKYHVGYKFGEFACTKKPFVFKPKKKKNKR